MKTISDWILTGNLGAAYFSDRIKPVSPITPTIDNTLTIVHKRLPIRNIFEKLTHYLQSELKTLKKIKSKTYREKKKQANS